MSLKKYISEILRWAWKLNKIRFFMTPSSSRFQHEKIEDEFAMENLRAWKLNYDWKDKSLKKERGQFSDWKNFHQPEWKNSQQPDWKKKKPETSKYNFINILSSLRQTPWLTTFPKVGNEGFINPSEWEL